MDPFTETDRAADRVFCIGKNYAAHVAELGDVPADDCVVFMKPPSSLVRPGETVRLPRGRGAVHHEVELVLALGEGGRDLPLDQALSRIAAIGLGVDLTLRDLQARLKAAARPWEVAKAFDQSALVSHFQPWSPGGADLEDITLECRVNGDLRQRGHTRDMIFPPARIIALLSKTWLLRRGDLIFTGTPAGVGPVAPGDTLSIYSGFTGEVSWSLT